MKTKIILEIGCNHQGSMNLAKQMMNEAFYMGVWAVKFQKRDMDSIPGNIGALPRDMSNSFGETYYEHRAALEFTIDEIRELKSYAENLDLVFICSVFDPNSLIQLIEAGVKHIKYPSQFFSNAHMINMAYEFGKNIKYYLSTGMHSGDEIKNSPWLKLATWIDIRCIMHCISVYPCSLDETNLSMIHEIGKYGPPGYSSHDKDGKAIPWAVVAGAKYIERHFTLDKTMKGSDHGTVSSDPADIRNIIQSIEYVEQMMGDGKRPLSPEEKLTAGRYRGGQC